MTDQESQAYWYAQPQVDAREQDEHYLVSQIRHVLLTPEQKVKLNQWGISIEDLLNGRVEGRDQDEKYSYFFDAWNNRLGRREFGY